MSIAAPELIREYEFAPQRVLVMRDDALEGIVSASDIVRAVADGKL